MAAQSSTSSPQDGSGGGEFSDNLVFQAPQPVREDYIQNAVNFLAHPKVKDSPVMYRRSFLEKKGLTKEEIDEAFCRVPDPQTNSTDVGAVGSQQVSIPNQSAGVQPYTAVQSPQAVTASVNAGPVVPHTQPPFSWSHTLLGVGVFLGFGASAAVVLKKLFLPRLKSWTQRVGAEGEERAGDELKSKLYEEIKEAIESAASAFSAIAKTNQELLASKDEDKKIFIKLAEAFDSQAEAFKFLGEALNHMRENRFSQYNLLEDHVQPAPWNGPSNNSWRSSQQQTNVYATSPNSDFEPGRHSYMPLPAEATSGSLSRSYFEQQQRVQRPGYGSQHQMSNERWNPGTPLTSYHGAPPYHNGENATIDDVHLPAPAVKSPFQRHWVPPQPPGVVMPEAAAAIRHLRQQPQPPGVVMPEAAAAIRHPRQQPQPPGVVMPEAAAAIRHPRQQPQPAGAASRPSESVATEQAQSGGEAAA